ESEKLRDEIIQYGISQNDGGTKIEIGSYVEKEKNHNLNKGQFKINDDRSLNEVIDELLNQEMLPSFCTACYRLGRTGEHFMEFSVPGFIKRFCSPNAILTLAEYLEDYAPQDTREAGYQLISKKIDELSKSTKVDSLKEKLGMIKEGKRDLYF